MSQQRFDQAAASWDEQPRRRELAAAVVAAIKEALPLTSEMAALEFGCGTGLLTCALAPQLQSVLATDTSKGMLEVLSDKIKTLGLANITPQRLDLLHDKVESSGFDLIFSAMTLHHIKDTAAVLAACFHLLRPGASLALADLDEEDGHFHDDMTGVEHCGFNTSKLAAQAAACGFVDVRFQTAHRIRKDKGDGQSVDYPIFLMTARRP